MLITRHGSAASRARAHQLLDFIEMVLLERILRRIGT